MHMACVDMFNGEHQNGRCAPMSPRISFSSDFIDAQQMIKYERSSRSEEAAAAASSDFEFSVTNYNMMAADELFFKGRLLPFKVDNCSSQLQKMTLRDELLNHDDDQDDTINTVSSRPPKSSSSRRWKELLGMKKTAHINVSKKAAHDHHHHHHHHHHGSMGKGSSSALATHDHGDDQAHVNSQSSQQERLTEGGSSCRNVEIGV